MKTSWHLAKARHVLTSWPCGDQVETNGLDGFGLKTTIHAGLAVWTSKSGEREASARPAAGVGTIYRAGYIFRISPEGFTRAGGQMGQHTAAAHAEARSPSAAGPGTHVHACGTTHRRCSAAPLSTEH